MSDSRPASASRPEGADDGYRPRWGLPSLLFALTFASTTYTGALLAGVDPLAGGDPLAGLPYSAPLMAILLTHELGHFIAGRIHRVAVSPPYFIPLPLVGLGTLGAVINIRERIRSRNALMDIGAAGPLAGLAVALPVLVYGLAESPVQPLPNEPVLIEGRSLLYLGLMRLVKGPIPESHDVFLTPTAFAGWVGLLVTMINLIPVAQLDGGHVAYALLGPRQNRVSRLIHRSLPFVALAVGLYYALPVYAQGARGSGLWLQLAAGMHWLVWWGLLWVLVRAGGGKHPPTDGDALSGGRRLVASLTLALFFLLFMPSWFRQGLP